MRMRDVDDIHLSSVSGVAVPLSRFAPPYVTNTGSTVFGQPNDAFLVVTAERQLPRGKNFTSK